MPLKYKIGDIIEDHKGDRYYIYSYDLDGSGDYTCGKLTEVEWNIWSCLGITKKVLRSAYPTRINKPISIPS